MGLLRLAQKEKCPERGSSGSRPTGSREPLRSRWIPHWGSQGKAPPARTEPSYALLPEGLWLLGLCRRRTGLQSKNRRRSSEQQGRLDTRLAAGRERKKRR